VWLASGMSGNKALEAASNREVVAVRHVMGFVFAVILAAVLLAGAGWGTWRVGALEAAGTSLTSMSSLLALGAMAGTGLLLGIMLVAPRVSPLAAGLPGLALLAWSVLRVVNTAGAERLIPLHGSHIATGFRTLLMGGVLALLGVVMVVPLFVPSRWRKRDAYDDFSRPTSTSLLQ
jgi:hypothetical protein